MDRYKETSNQISQIADDNTSVIGSAVLLMAEMAMSLASIADSLDSAESATSPGDERGTGRWVEVDDYAICGECGAVHHGADRNYCPNCGRKMKTGKVWVRTREAWLMPAAVLNKNGTYTEVPRFKYLGARV